MLLFFSDLYAHEIVLIDDLPNSNQIEKCYSKKVVTYLKQCSAHYVYMQQLILVCCDKLGIPIFICNKTEKPFGLQGSIILTTANNYVTATYQETDTS